MPGRPVPGSVPTHAGKGPGARAQVQSLMPSRR